MSKHVILAVEQNNSSLDVHTFIAQNQTKISFPILTRLHFPLPKGGNIVLTIIIELKNKVDNTDYKLGKPDSSKIWINTVIIMGLFDYTIWQERHTNTDWGKWIFKE